MPHSRARARLRRQWFAAIDWAYSWLPLGGVPVTYSEATAVAVDSQDNIYIAGDTNSASFVSTTGSFHNTSKPPYFDFITKISADNSTLAYSSPFTGAAYGVTGLAVDRL
jgi:hypothetical protein